MKIKNINLTLAWETIRDIPNYVDLNLPFPNYNVRVRNTDNTLIENYTDLNYYEPIMEHRQESLEGAKKTKLFYSLLKNKAKNIFKYDFSNNYKSYKKINNKIGFFKNLLFEIDYVNDYQEDFKVEAEYPEIEDINKNSLFNKVYRSSDYLNVKFLINKEYFKQKEIHSFLILSEVSNRTVKNRKLSNLLVENIQRNWLDINNDVVLLTVPFIDTDIVEISENLNISVIPLNFVQSEIYNFLKTQEKEEDINDLFLEFYQNQVLNIGKIYKQSVNNETLIFYQNYIYLFNKESFASNTLDSELSINDISFKQYFPLLNKNKTNKTICLSDDLNTDNVLDNNYNLDRDYLGYYDKNLINYIDAIIDLDYLQNKNILKVQIVEIEEINNEATLYIEFITSFCDDEKFYIESSGNLKLYQKYKTLINDKNYITFLFKYSYSLDSLSQYLNKNSSINKNQIISEKDLINFSAKLIL
jgi:hypothetical protein